MAETTCDIIIHAPPEIVYTVLWDASRYPEFISDVIEADVSPNATSTAQTIHFHLQLIRTLSYSVQMQGTPVHRIDWTLAGTSEFLQEHSGSWKVEPSADRRTCRLEYFLNIHFSIAIPDAVIRRLIDFNMPTMLRQIKARAEAMTRDMAH